jgi:hypothetical protein
MLSDISEVEFEDLLYERDQLREQLAQAEKQAELLLKRVNTLQAALDKKEKK